MLLEEHWTRRPAEVYEREQALFGDLDDLDTPTTDVRVGSAATADHVKELLESIRAEQPDEPMWTGVDSIEVRDDGVHVGFHRHVDPGLRPADGVEVACVLYGDPTISHAQAEGRPAAR